MKQTLRHMINKGQGSLMQHLFWKGMSTPFTAYILPGESLRAPQSSPASLPTNPKV